MIRGFLNRVQGETVLSTLFSFFFLKFLLEGRLVVGEDQHGRVFVEQISGTTSCTTESAIHLILTQGDALNGRPRRMVLNHGVHSDYESKSLHPLWHSWLHHRCDVPTFQVLARLLVAFDVFLIVPGCRILLPTTLLPRRSQNEFQLCHEKRIKQSHSRQNLSRLLSSHRQPGNLYNTTC